MACQDLKADLVLKDLIPSLGKRISGSDTKPHLHIVWVEQAGVPMSFYVKTKRDIGNKIGGVLSESKLPSDISLESVLDVLRDRFGNPAIHGVMLLRPLPEHLKEYWPVLADSIRPDKDVECVHPHNVGRMFCGESYTCPATARGVLYLIEHLIRVDNFETKGRTCVILGKSPISGLPLSVLLQDQVSFGMTVCLCDELTPKEEMWRLTRQADLLIVAAGHHHLVQDPDNVKMHSVVIDIGFHRITNAKGQTTSAGDVDSAAVRSRCRWITPVPGGVGPMTNVCFWERCVMLAGSQLPLSRV